MRNQSNNDIACKVYENIKKQDCGEKKNSSPRSCFLQQNHTESKICPSI